MESMGKIENPLDDEQENRTLKEYFLQRQKRLPKPKNKFQVLATTFSIVYKIMEERGY